MHTSIHTPLNRFQVKTRYQRQFIKVVKDINKKYYKITRKDCFLYLVTAEMILVSCYQSVINQWEKQDLIIFLSNLLVTMHANKSLSYHNHSISTPNVDYLIMESRKSLISTDSPQLSEKDQIQSIRKLAKFMLEQEEQARDQCQKICRKSLGKSVVSINKQQLRKADNIMQGKSGFQNGKHLLLQLKVESNKFSAIKEQNRQKKLNNSNFQIKFLESNKPQNKKKSTTIAIKKQKFLTNVKSGQNNLNYTRHNEYLHPKIRDKQIVHNQKDSQKPKIKKEGTKQQVDKIFEGITKRGNELLLKKQEKFKIVVQQRKKQELKGFTFTPNLQSCKNLRKTDSKGFLQRLKDDQQNRQKKKVQIISKQLKKTTFKPELNKNRSTQSKSKINSFRQQDLPYFNIQSNPSADFQQMLSRLSSSKNSVRSLTKSSINQESSISAKTCEFNFIQ